jgi:MraZ protein
MALTGTFLRTLDDKLRLAVPKPLKEGLKAQEDGEVYLAPGNEGCVSVYSPAEFERFADQVAMASPGRADVRSFVRLFYAQAERVVLDRQSRIRIPDRLLKHAGIERDVVILGVRDHAEIWNADSWQTFMEQMNSQFDQLTSEVLDSQFGHVTEDNR